MTRELKVYNRRNKSVPIPDDAVDIGRPSKWSNPFIIGRDGTRIQVIQKFRKYLRTNPKLVEEAKRELANKALLCWCSPLECHGDVWLEIANPRIKELREATSMPLFASDLI
jgi:hypothetical protein